MNLLLSFDILGYLYSPSVTNAIGALIVAFLLGLAHGITPDEHTWPITFSYSVGSYSSKGGIKSGLLFSTGFTIQRAVMSEIAYLGLALIFTIPIVEPLTYIIVGIVMFLSGAYILKSSRYFHTHFLEKFLHHHIIGKTDHVEEEHKVPSELDEPRPVPTKMTLVHGVIAGFGFGAYATIVYFTLAPAMPSAYFGFLPGLFFGLGTMIMQIIFGFSFGKWIQRKKLGIKEIGYVGRKTGGRTLYYGGVAFAVVGILLLFFPAIDSFSITTPILVHNLHELGAGFFLVVLTVGAIGSVSYVKSMREVLAKASLSIRPNPNIEKK
ncbi:MAG: hypothetical protein QXT39_04120 [Conexivisphaerales archaeon]